MTLLASPDTWLHPALDVLSDGAWEWREESRRGNANTGWRNCFGPRGDTLDGWLKQLPHPEQQHCQRAIEALRQGHQQSARVTVTAPCGGRFQLRLAQLTALPEASLVACLQRLDTPPRHNETDPALLAAAFESREGIAILGPDGQLLRINGAFAYLMGYTVEALVQRPTAHLLASPEELDRLLRLGESGHWQGEVTYLRKDGSTFSGDTRIRAITDSQLNSSHYIIDVADITARKRLEERIYQQANLDVLTDLPNRRYFMERLEREFARSRRHGHLGALLFVDLDGFKAINDRYGHQIGDEFLCVLAHTLRGTLRQEDTLARLGGDEFVILLPDAGTDASEALQRVQSTAQKILLQLQGPHRVGALNLAGSGSIGISLYPAGQQSPSDVLHQADTAMYRAKLLRSGSAFFSPSMQGEVDHHRQLQSALRQSLTSGNLPLHFQPQVDLHGHIVGAEALLRWAPPGQATIPPEELLPIIERHGLNAAVDRAVLRIACQALTRWEQLGLPAQFQALAINISPGHFADEHFPDSVATALRHSGPPAHRLALEITEAALSAAGPRAATHLLQLRQLGVRVILDDFGRGDCPFSTLPTFALDAVKIDRQFISGLEHDNAQAGTVRMLLAAAEQLGLSVTGEGVETVPQQTFLQTLGCQHYQGHLFADALPSEDFETLLKHGKLDALQYRRTHKSRCSQS